MEWQLMLLVILGGLILMMLTGMPIAFSFLLVCLALVFFLWGGEAGLRHINLAITARMTRFVLMPLPLFILMGEVIFTSGIAPTMIDP